MAKDKSIVKNEDRIANLRDYRNRKKLKRRHCAECQEELMYFLRRAADDLDHMYLRLKRSQSSGECFR